MHFTYYDEIIYILAKNGRPDLIRVFKNSINKK